MEELSTGAQLEDEVVVLFGFAELNELHDIRMVQLTHDLDLLKDVGALGKGED